MPQRVGSAWIKIVVDIRQNIGCQNNRERISLEYRNQCVWLKINKLINIFKAHGGPVRLFRFNSFSIISPKQGPSVFINRRKFTLFQRTLQLTLFLLYIYSTVYGYLDL